MGIRSARVVGVAVALVLTACGTEAPSSTSDPSPSAPSIATPSPTVVPTTATTADDAPVTAAGPSVEVELLDPGADPRRELRLSPEPGDRGAVDMRMTMDIDLALDGQPAPGVEIPPMLMGFELVVDEVSADAVTMSYTYDRVGLDGPDPGGMEQALKGIEGLSGSATTTRRGAYLDGRIDVPSGADPAMAQMLTQFDQQMASLTVPMPEEPVGVGARWRVTTGLELNGVRVEQTATYTLQSFEGDDFTVDVEMEQRFVPGTIQSPGASVEILEGTGTGRGSMTGSLRFPMAMQGDVQMSSSMVSRISAEGQQQTMEQDQQVRMEMAPRPEDP